jgi:hypothetical protein
MDINTHQRLFDLVRYMRSELHEAELITDEEYAWLAAEAPMAKGSGSPSPRRLEDYDDVRANLAKADSRIARLEEEIGSLRAIFPKICEAIGNGSCCSHDSSILFLQGIPNEIRLRLAFATPPPP